jgi:hypothetical protein
MAVAFAPFEDEAAPKPPLAQEIIINKALPVSDNTECNYIVMFFVAGVFLLGIVDAMRN